MLSSFLEKTVFGYRADQSGTVFAWTKEVRKREDSITCHADFGKLHSDRKGTDTQSLDRACFLICSQFAYTHPTKTKMEYQRNPAGS